MVNNIKFIEENTGYRIANEKGAKVIKESEDDKERSKSTRKLMEDQ